MLKFLSAEGFGPEQFVLIGLLVVMVIIIIVLPMFTNKKRQKQINALQESVKVGATIKTVGGIIGKVIEIRETSPVDKEMVIETGVGDNKATMVFDIQAVYQVMSSANVVEQVVQPVSGISDNTAETQEVKEEMPAAVDIKEDPVNEAEQAAASDSEPVQVEMNDSEKQEEPVSEKPEPKETKESTNGLTPSANSSKVKSTAKKTGARTTKKS